MVRARFDATTKTKELMEVRLVDYGVLEKCDILKESISVCYTPAL